MLQASRRRQTAITGIEGIGEKTAERLAEAGITTLGDLLEKSAEELSALPGLGEKTAEKILEAARAAEESLVAADQAEEDGEGADEAESEQSETPEETGVRE